MKKKALTDKFGEVRELGSEDIRQMQAASEVLSPALQKVLPKAGRGQRRHQKAHRAY